MLNTRLGAILRRFSTCLLLGLTLSVVGPPLLAPRPAHAMTVVLDQSHTAGTGATGINAGERITFMR